jgi:hypothetical protein
MLNSFKDWLARPFSTDMDALHWFLFYGLIIAIAVIWHFIDKQIRA